MQKNIEDSLVKKEILKNLKKEEKRKYISEIINKINKNNFSTLDFVKLSKDENVSIEKLKINNVEDDKVLKKELINQIYTYPKNKVVIVADIGLSENFLVNVTKIHNVSLDENSNEYDKYYNLSKVRITNVLFKTYDSYLRNKYEINVNHNSLESVKNYFK